MASRLTPHLSPQRVRASGRRTEAPARLELHVGELALQGFPEMDPEALGGAVQTALARLLADEGAPPGLGQGGPVDRLDGGEFQVEAGMDIQTLGARIARAVYEGLKGGVGR